MLSASTARRSPDSASNSAVWPLPATPAMPTISPARIFEIDVVQRRAAAAVAGDAEVVQQQARLAHLVGDLARGARHLGADHQPGEARRALHPRIDLGDELAAAQHGGALAEAAHLVELVAR